MCFHNREGREDRGIPELLQISVALGGETMGRPTFAFGWEPNSAVE